MEKHQNPEETLLRSLPPAAARAELVNLGETKGSSLETGFRRLTSSVGTKSSEGWKPDNGRDDQLPLLLRNFYQPLAEGER